LTEHRFAVNKKLDFTSPCLDKNNSSTENEGKFKAFTKPNIVSNFLNCSPDLANQMNRFKPEVASEEEKKEFDKENDKVLPGNVENRLMFVRPPQTSELKVSKNSEIFFQKSDQLKETFCDKIGEVEDDDVMELSPETIKSFREDLIQNETFQIADKRVDLTLFSDENDIFLEERGLSNDKTSIDVLVRKIAEDDLFYDPADVEDLTTSCPPSQQVDPITNLSDEQFNPGKKHTDPKPVSPKDTKKTKGKRKKSNSQEAVTGDPDPSKHFAPKTFLQSLSADVENPL
jgi:hypothetical protein